MIFMQTPKLEKEKLREYRKELLTSLDNNLTISINDKYGRITYANDNFCKLLGANMENLIGETNALLKSHLHTNKLYKNLWATIRKGDKWEGVLFHKFSNARFYWLKTTITPQKDEKGEVSSYLSVYTDITDYYNNQYIDDTVEVCEQTLLKKITNVLLAIDERGKIIKATNVNNGKHYQNIVGNYVYDFIDSEYHQGVKFKIKQAFDGAKPEEFQFMSTPQEPDNALYISEIRPVFNNHNKVIFLNISTERKTNDIKIISDLKAIETKYKTIFRSINTGIIVVTDSSGNIAEWNKGAELAFGYSEEEILGHSLTNLISKHHVETSLKELLRAKNKLDEMNGGDTLEMVGLRKNGAEFPVEFTISSWYCGKDRYYCAMMLDISKRKNLENKLKQKSKDLEIFLYRSAHDLKAPLTSIEGLVNLISDEDTGERLSSIVDMLKTSLDTGKLLLDNLAFASVISQKKEEVSVINFKRKLDKTLKSLSGLDNFENIEFEIEINQTTRFYSNKELVISLFQNLVQNAIKYSKPVSKNHKPSILIQVEQSSEDVEILVSDNGLGISKDNIDKIFNLYYRANNEGTQGTGLGLYIVKHIVEDLNGTITVESELNNGSEFRITLPNLSKKHKK